MNPSETGVLKSLSSEFDELEFDELELVSVTAVSVFIVPVPMPKAIDTTGNGTL
ncbi:MAG: hypothetical protein MAG581_01798 [Deltaproteobacteria bacterium]|nr:hypothetical protein [Deltaproteobacteria bacterium]